MKKLMQTREKPKMPMKKPRQPTKNPKMLKCGKVEKGLKCHGSIMGHGWGLHMGTWKMGAWGQNIAPKILHVLVGNMFQGLELPKHQKRMLSRLLKLNMFQWVIVFEVQVSKFMF
jgi:hypothetical protein